MAIANMLAILIEVLLAVLLTDSFFKPRFSKKIIKYAAISAIAIILFAVNMFTSGYALKTPIEIFLIILLIAFLYTGNLRSKVICCVLWGIALSLSGILTEIILTILPIDRWIPNDQSIFQTTLQIILPRACLMAMIFFLSAFARIKTDTLSLRYWLMLLTVPMVTLAVLTVFQYNISQLPDGIKIFGDATRITINETEVVIPGITLYGYMVIAIIGLLFINVIVFTLFARLKKNMDMQNKYDLLRRQMALQEESIEKLDVSYTRMRELRHDMQNQLIVLSALLDSQKYDELKSYIKTMTNTVDEAAFMTISGQSAVDAVLNNKLLIAHQNRITTNFEVGKLTDLFVEPMDLCIVLANILDNAVEACVKIPEGAERYIRLKVAPAQDYLIVSSENPVHQAPVKLGRDYVSTKSDKNKHGLGLKSIKTTADKYKGEYMTRCVDGVFTIIVKFNRV